MLTLKTLSGPGFGPVDARIDAGKCLAVMGASGSGKTRLLRGIADLDPVTGDCLLQDTSCAAMPAPEWRRRVAYVPAEPGWWAATVHDHFSSADECASYAERFGVDRAALSRPIEDLSTGERQRLALARALQFQPRVLLLDEPTGPLDQQATALVEDEIREQMQQGVAVVLVTHDGEQAARLNAERRTMVDGRLA